MKAVGVVLCAFSAMACQGSAAHNSAQAEITHAPQHADATEGKSAGLNAEVLRRRFGAGDYWEPSAAIMATTRTRVSQKLNALCAQSASKLARNFANYGCVFAATGRVLRFQCICDPTADWFASFVEVTGGGTCYVSGSVSADGETLFDLATHDDFGRRDCFNYIKGKPPISSVHLAEGRDAGGPPAAELGTGGAR